MYPNDPYFQPPAFERKKKSLPAPDMAAQPAAGPMPMGDPFMPAPSPWRGAAQGPPPQPGPPPTAPPPTWNPAPVGAAGGPMPQQPGPPRREPPIAQPGIRPPRAYYG